MMRCSRARTAWIACLVVAMLATMAGITPVPTAADTDTPVPAVSAEEQEPEGLASLPCFRCHAPERFADPAVFPHETHMAMGLHCNQCHLVKAHESISLNGETCKSCHNVTLIEFAKTSMSATFDHEMHASMFGCKNCHNDLFRMKSGSATVTMKSIYAGKHCGKCHNGELASGPNNCASCHRN